MLIRSHISLVIDTDISWARDRRRFITCRALGHYRNRSYIKQHIQTYVYTDRSPLFCCYATDHTQQEGKCRNSRPQILLYGWRRASQCHSLSSFRKIFHIETVNSRGITRRSCCEDNGEQKSSSGQFRFRSWRQRSQT